MKTRKELQNPDGSFYPKASPQHTPTPWTIQRKPLLNVAMTGNKDKFCIMDGDAVIASIPRSWKKTPTVEDRACGAQPFGERSAKQADDLAAFIVRAVNAHDETLAFLKFIEAGAEDRLPDAEMPSEDELKKRLKAVIAKEAR